MGFILNFIAGAGFKMLSSLIGKWMEMKRTRDLLLANAPIEKIQALQSGEDTLSSGGKVTRRFIALQMTWLWIFVVVYLMVVHMDAQLAKEVALTPSLLWGWIFPSVDSATIMVSPVMFVLVATMEFVSFVLGFYMTKLSKGG